MWDAYRLPTIGYFSLRKIATFLIAVFVSVFLWNISFAPTSYAADASWDGNNIKYQNDQVYAPDTASIPGIPAGQQTYVFKQADQGVAHVIYFPNGQDTGQPFDAKFQTFNYSDSGGYSNPQGERTVSVDAKGGAPGQESEADKKEETQCDVPGVGWIVCTTSRFIANGMDQIFEWIAGFLEVKPVTNDTNTALYQSWAIMRSFANIMFVIAFLLIIYSQITSIGFSNYNVKKMLPRLVVAALLVNLSYYICSIAVDISNILGFSLQQALIDIRQSFNDNGSSGFDASSWKNITEYILSGGTIAAAGTVGVLALTGATVGGSLTGLVFLLFPMLVVGAIAVLIALIVLAARQALITILIVVSPLAFVAYLLPNTEKWFDKWRGLFLTLLLTFPLFSLLFGGSQLASYIILQNADQLSVVLLALFVQVAPLAITPFLVKFSGSLLGRLAGMVNNPSKGVVDRTRNWSKERMESRAKRGIAAGAEGRGPLRRAAFKREKNRLNREGLKKQYASTTEAGWAEDERAHTQHRRIASANLRKSAADSLADRQFEVQKAGDAGLQAMAYQQRINQGAIKNLQQKEEADWAEVQARNVSANADNRFSRIPGAGDAARLQMQQANVIASQISNAQAEQKSDYANDMIKSQALQRQAGGIAAKGADTALAIAVSQERKAYGDRVNEADAILKHFNLSGAQRQAHALGQEVTVEADGAFRILRADSTFTREAAIEKQMATGTLKDVEQIIAESGNSLAKFKTTISDAIASNGIAKKAVYLGGRTIDDTGQGNIVGEGGIDMTVKRTIVGGKISGSDLATNAFEALERMYRVASEGNAEGLSPEDAVKFTSNIKALKAAAYSVLHNQNLSKDVKDNSKGILEKMVAELPGDIPSAT